MRTDGRTDRQRGKDVTKLIDAFRNSANRLNKIVSESSMQKIIPNPIEIYLQILR